MALSAEQIARHQVNAGNGYFIDKDGNPQNIFEKSINTTVPPARKSTILTRPLNTTAYAIGDIINDKDMTTLPKISFGSAYANRFIQVTGITIATDGAGKNMKIHFFNAPDINGAGGSVKADNVDFSPTFAEISTKASGQPVVVDENMDLGTTIDIRLKSEISRKIQLDANGDFYFAPITLETWTPASGQKFQVIFYCYIL